MTDFVQRVIQPLTCAIMCSFTQLEGILRLPFPHDDPGSSWAQRILDVSESIIPKYHVIGHVAYLHQSTQALGPLGPNTCPYIGGVACKMVWCKGLHT